MVRVILADSSLADVQIAIDNIAAERLTKAVIDLRRLCALFVQPALGGLMSRVAWFQPEITVEQIARKRQFVVGEVAQQVGVILPRCRLAGDFVASLAHTEEAERLAQQTDNEALRISVGWGFVYASYNLGRLREARERLDQLIQQTREKPDLP